MTDRDPMAAELERIEAELAAQNRAFDELRISARSLGDVELRVSRKDLDAIANPRGSSRKHSSSSSIAPIRC